MSFSQAEIKILTGKMSAIARKHGVSHVYVRDIMYGNRKVKTELAKKIFSDLKVVAEFFMPKEA